LTDSTDSIWALVALTTVVVPLFVKKATVEQTRNVMVVPLGFVFLYAVSYHLFPPLARATIAVTAIGVTISWLRFKRVFHPGVLGLVYLSLPVIPSLQFYGGYPLRVFVASVTAPILRLGGFAVVREGTCLNWAGQLVWIDAPCSGVRMLWVGLYLVFTLVSLYEARLFRTLLLLGAAFVLILAGNIFRAVALFYLEAQVFPTVKWGHEFVGFMAFVSVAIGILAAFNLMRKQESCVEVPST
jgi:exosortase/archaeosortase family protein